MPLRSAAPVRFPLLGFALALTAACGHTPETTAKGPTPGDPVSVGYGTQERRDLTGAVASLTGEDIEHLRVSRVEELLENGAPGVQVLRRPGGHFSIQIRGVRSLMGGNEPLIVVDGVPLQPHGSFSVLEMLNPRDVMRIDVLKDAGSTAAYGSRGANGVILITTKR